MNVVSDDHHSFPIAEDLIALGGCRRAALKVELLFERIEMIEIADVRTGADLEHHKWIALGCRPEVVELDAVAGCGDLLKILDDLVPTRELLIGAYREAEEGLGHGNGLRDGGK